MARSLPGIGGIGRSSPRGLLQGERRADGGVGPVENGRGIVTRGRGGGGHGGVGACRPLGCGALSTG